MLKFFIRLFWASFLFLMLPWTMQGQSFPYVVSVQTVQGLCYDDSHIIITLSDNSGHTVQIDPETHNAADSISYPLRNVQYYYQNITAGTSLQYSYDNDIMVPAGTYLVGVVAYIPGANGGWTSVDIPYGNVQVTSQYNHLVASVLDVANSTGYGNERCGIHPALSCINCGRMQLRLTDGHFPFHVVILNEQNDTVRDVTYNQRVQSGTNANLANYRDYYTFDGLAAGNYSIFISDACNYSISLSATIPDAAPAGYSLYSRSIHACTESPNTVSFAFSMNNHGILRDYMHPYLDSMVQYRFVNPGHDTTVWRHAQFVDPNGGWEYATDTLTLNSRFCDILGDTIEFHLYDLCMDSIFKASWHVVSGFSFGDSIKNVSLDAIEIPDTCLIHVSGGMTTQSYLYYGEDPRLFGWWTGSTGNYISTYRVCYSGCPLSYDVWSLVDSSLLAHAESNDYTGLGVPVSFAVDTTIPVHIAISDSYGCVLTELDTIFTFQTAPASDKHYWWECGHFENNIYGFATCCENRYMWIQEHWVEADSFRRDMTLRLIESPIYNRFNFTAVRQNGVWTVTNEDPSNTFTSVEFTYEDGWRATIRDSECLAPGRYTFEILTDCGIDTVTYQWQGYYTDSLFYNTPHYETHQVCDQLVVQPDDISLVRNIYYIYPDVDNNVPDIWVNHYPSYYYTISGLTNNVYFYVSAPVSNIILSEPGTYRITVATNSGSSYCNGINISDTITFTPTFLDFDVADAYVCDVSSSFGSVMAQAIHGNKPYTYGLYNQWNATGNLIATSDTGFFNNVPMMSGDHLSVLVTDSCNNSFSVNLTAAVLTQETLVWENGNTLHCEGDSLHLEAKQFPFQTSYHWTGPNGFSDTSRVIDILIPYGSESGWYRVEIVNSLCENILSDSIYITVTPAPRVTIFGDTIACPNGQITLNFVPHGTGTVNFDILRSSDNYRTHYSVAAGDTVQQDLPLFSNITFWADSVVDNACAYHSFVDSFSVLMRVLDYDPVHVYDTVLENDLPFGIYDTIFQNPGTYEITLSDQFGCDSAVFVHLAVLYNVSAEDDSTVCFNALPLIWNDTIFRTEMLDTLEGLNVLGIRLSSVLTASNRVDSVVMMTVYVHPTYDVADTNIICANELPYTWNEIVFIEAGTQYATLQTVDGCDSVVAMMLIVNPLYSVTDTATVCADALPHTWNGVTFTEAGTQSATLQTVHGCDSTVAMTLLVKTSYSVTDTQIVCASELPHTWNGVTFNGAGTQSATLQSVYGCDSIVAMTLMVKPIYSVTDTATVCQNELPHTWNGVTFTEAGTQSATLPSIDGCDSVVAMTLLVKPLYSVTDTAAVCSDELPHTWNSVTFTGAGTQSITLQTVDGCDSVVAMMLIVNPLYSVTDTQTVCADALPHTWNGVTFTEAGTQSATLQTVHGCDSIVAMTLLVKTSYSVTDTQTVCASELPYSWNGVTFTGAGTQSATLQSVYGCDSVVTMTLMVKPIYSVTDTSTVCQNELPHTWNGVTFTEAGTQSATLPSIDGCDSTVAMTLLVKPLYSVTDTATICANELPYTWNGFTFTGAGTQSITLQTVDGCDSVIAMMLIVNPLYSVTDTQTVCADELPHTWNGVTFTEAGTQSATLQTVHGCDSVVAMTLLVKPTYSVTDTHTVCASELPYTWNGIVFNGAGTQSVTLPTVDGCDSTVAMTLMVNPTYSVNDTTVVCANELPYSWNGLVFNGAGTQSLTFPTVDGCDSVVAMTLIVNPLYSVTDTAAVCADELPHTWNGVTFTGAGTQSVTLQSIYGCDSVVAMTLMVNPLYSVTDTAIVCASELPYTWNGVVFNGAGTQSATLQTIYGCDSVVAMTLFVNPTYSVSITDTICAIELPHTWNGIVFTGAGIQSATLPTVDGCDSMVSMTLVVLPMPEFYDTLHLVQNQMPYHFLPSDTILTLSSTFIQFQYIHPAEGCDSIFHQTVFVHLNTTQQVDTVVCAASLPTSWHGHLFNGANSFTDTLQTVYQSDSIVTYTLTVTNISADIGNVVHIVCFGDSTGSATATVSGGSAPLTLRWTNAANTLVSSTANLGGQPAGFYTFTVTDNLGCSASDTVTLRHLHATMAPGAVSEDQDLCEGNTLDPFLGTPASGGADGHYQWQINLNGTDWVAAPGTNNAQDYTYLDSTTSSFSLRRAWISAACGTVFSNTVNVNVWMNHHDTVEANVCQGEPFQNFGFNIEAAETDDVGLLTFTQFLPSSHCDSTLTLLLTVNPKYEALIEENICEGDGYFLNGFSVNQNETIGTDELTRELSLQSASGCDSIVRLHLSVTDTSLHIQSSTDDFCERLSTELTAVTEMTDYLWNTGETSQEITVTQPGLYRVTAYQGQCNRTASYQVETCHTDLHLPNTITPVYSSGLNDYFSIPEIFQQTIRRFEIRIYDRWGELVFHSNDKNFKWRGECKGQVQHNSIFNYIILFTDKMGDHQVKGSLLVL